MKTLNRPMFRYGGPIKEGVMNGIREPKRNGGSMGTRKAALVGNPVYPQTNGRENHYINFLAPVVAGAIRYGKPLLQGAKRIFGKTTPASVTKGTKFNKAQSIKEFGKGSGRATGVTMNPSKFDPNYLGRDPILRSVGAIGKGIFSPTSKGVVAKAARFATAPSSIVAGVAYYMWPDGKERTAPPNKVDKDRRGTSDAPGGGDPGMYSTPKADQPEALTAEEVKALENKTRNEQMDRYREIIDIKGMNKDAAYKSLIDASKIIQEGGNLKKSLKDGSLISKVTAAASKRFDKVSDTENALRSLVVKGEIDNELNKVDKDLKRRALEGTIAVNDKKLSGASLGETANAVYEKTGKFPTGKNLANVARTKGIEVVGIEDTAAVDEWIGENGGDEIAYMQDVIARGADVTPGPHVLRSRIIIVDDEGNVSPFF
jgi:hypothetical protein